MGSRPASRTVDGGLLADHEYRGAKLLGWERRSPRLEDEGGHRSERGYSRGTSRRSGPEPQPQAVSGGLPAHRGAGWGAPMSAHGDVLKAQKDPDLLRGIGGRYLVEGPPEVVVGG